ncbi:MAG: ComF family protein [Candidatus Rokubacteria bacterium]|nr:ComF family protein [Candidatus Rokubacteria bacterium]
MVREALHTLKFGGCRPLARPLGELLAGVGPMLPGSRPDLLVPVPLHPRRERERGFNQAELLAAAAGRVWGVPVRSRVLVRRLATRAQSDLAAGDRRANVRGAFALALPELVAGRHVVVVDDILTTGATVEECATSLRRGGARPVGVVTVARAL